MVDIEEIGWDGFIVGSSGSGLFLRAPQQMLRTHRSLEAYCSTLWLVFSFFRLMEHRWNEIDRGKPKYSGGKPCPSATLSTTNPTWTHPGSNPGLRNCGLHVTHWTSSLCTQVYKKLFQYLCRVSIFRAVISFRKAIKFILNCMFSRTNAGQNSTGPTTLV
jgi:hypothetical protein